MAEEYIHQSVASTEEWRPLASLQKKYAASNYGRIMRIVGGAGICKENRILKQTPDPRGRLCVFPNVDAIKHTKRVHTLVAEAFLGPCPVGQVVRHLDGNQTNNVAINLAYGTMKDNMDDRARHGKTARGDDRHGKYKLTAEKVREIRRLRATHTLRELGKMFNVTSQSIDAVARRHSWAHVE